MPLFIICPRNFQHTFQEWFSLAWPVCCSHFLHADSIHDAKVVVAVAALIPLSMEWSIPMDVVCPFGEKVLQFCVLRNTAKLNNDTFLAMFWFYSLWPLSHPSVVLSSLTGCWLAGWSGAPLAGVGACQLRLLLVIETMVRQKPGASWTELGRSPYVIQQLNCRHFFIVFRWGRVKSDGKMVPT